MPLHTTHGTKPNYLQCISGFIRVTIIFCSAMPPQQRSINLIISVGESSTATAAAFSLTGTPRTAIVVITVNDPHLPGFSDIVLVINLSVLKLFTIQCISSYSLSKNERMIP